MARDKNLRQKILEEAIGILYREGVDRITMRALAEKLGYSPAAIYLHFSGKDELQHEIGRFGFNRLSEQIESVFSMDDPEEALRELGRRVVAFALENSELYRLMYQDLPWQEGIAEDPRIDEIRRRSRALYQRGIESGRFRPSDPDVETLVGWSMIHGFVQLVTARRLSQPALEPELARLRDAVIETHLRALIAR